MAKVFEVKDKSGTSVLFTVHNVLYLKRYYGDLYVIYLNSYANIESKFDIKADMAQEILAEMEKL